MMRKLKILGLKIWDKKIKQNSLIALAIWLFFIVFIFTGWLAQWQDGFNGLFLPSGYSADDAPLWWGAIILLFEGMILVVLINNIQPAVAVQGNGAVSGKVATASIKTTASAGEESLNPSASPLVSESPKNSTEKESFALMMGESEKVASPLPQVKPTAPAWLKSLLATPRAMTNYLFIMLFTIISLALILKIFIKIKIQHPDLIFNGVFLLLVISSFLWLNQFVALSSAKIF